ncbi:MAG: GNAT family N-acetyltransferase [Bacteroidetes bacterium]|nr:GNAT family N-acetyltransferase [Bacteroidota bacterium]
MKKIEIKIIDYRPEHQSHFERLNRHWIEKYFWLEPIDKFVLMEPEKAILQRGGNILMATINNEIAGTVALKKVDETTYEFTKMAVDEKFQGNGLGYALTKAAIEKAKIMGAEKLLLYSHTSLKAAIHLYRKVGFRETHLEPGVYSRSDIKMEMDLDQIKIIKADEMYANAISTIGKKSFHDAFLPTFNRYEDLVEYLDYTYNVEKITDSIKKSNNVFFVALYKNKLAGFAKVKKQSLNMQLTGSRQMELQKIYVLKEFHGTGVAAALLHSVIGLAKNIRPACIWLDVYIGNKRGIRFYEKNGFEKFGKHSFKIGTQIFSYDLMILPGAVFGVNQESSQIVSYGND